VSRHSRRVERFVDAIAEDRRPPGFRASAEDVDVLAAAIELSAARAGADLPNPEFVAALATRVGVGAQRSGHGSSPLITRRRLLGAAGFAAAAAAGAVTERAVTSRSDSTPRDLVPDATTWTPVASVEALRAGQVVQFSAGGVAGFVSNRGGQYQAVSAVCTHQGCILKLNTSNQQLQCPCHRATFNLDGDVLSHELPIPLPQLPRIATRVRDGNVEAQVAASPPIGPTS
jgi:nitrite reductase/ring-hydroxylating ferredoxin subunit